MVAIGPAAGEMMRAMRMPYRRFVVPVLRTLLGAVFAYAGMVKVRAAGDFAESIAGFRLLPPAFVDLTAMGLPVFEILLGVLLVAGWRRRTMAFCALLTGGIFLVALVSAWTRGIAVDCGCFGAAGKGLSPERQLWVSIGRDVLLMVAAGAVYRDESARPTKDGLA